MVIVRQNQAPIRIRPGQNFSVNNYTKYKIFVLRTSNFREATFSRSASLVEREMLWEHELTGECFRCFFGFSQTSTSVSILNLPSVCSV